MAEIKKKVTKKAPVKEKKAEIKEKKVEGKEIGRVSGWFSNVSVAAIKLSAPLKIGDKIHIKGHTTDFEEKVASMQIENKVVKEAKKGDHIGIKVKDKVRPNDAVFLVK
jgi:putative protease